MQAGGATERGLALHDIITASRPFSWINTSYVFVAGAVIGAGWGPRAIVGGLYFLFPYNLLLYGINDVFDYESDLLNPRKNSIEGAVIRPRRFRALYLAVAVTNLPFLVYLFLTSSPRAALVLAFLLFTSFAYSVPPLRFKEVPFLDAFTSATHFVMPLVFGLLYGRSGVFPWFEAVAFVCWSMASQAFGAIQDIGPDRAAGLASIATFLGARGTALFSFGLYLAALALILAARQSVLYLAVAVVVLAYPAHILLFLRDPSADRAHRHWRFFLYWNLVTGTAITWAFILHARGVGR
ncbi:MAG: prenyltransferase [Dehalococcoidia bacterium]